MESTDSSQRICSNSLVLCVFFSCLFSSTVPVIADGESVCQGPGHRDGACLPLLPQPLHPTVGELRRGCQPRAVLQVDAAMPREDMGCHCLDPEHH